MHQNVLRAFIAVEVFKPFSSVLSAPVPLAARSFFFCFALVYSRRTLGNERDWPRSSFSTVAAVQSCFCFIIVAAAIVLGIGALFLLFVVLYSQRVASQSCETLGELLHHPLV